MNPIMTDTSAAASDAAVNAAANAATSNTATVDTLLAALPTSTLIYIVLLIATYALHAIFMQYTIGGALWTLGAAIRGRFSPNANAPRDVLAIVVRDWLPSAVSGAITAGIAPLLFVQIVYQKSFYTANLLLFNRWMLLLPALIVAIYALYVVKAHKFARGRFVKSLAAAVATALIAYTGLAFVENHLLSLQPAAWPAIYGGTAHGPSVEQIALRFGMWLFAALPTFAMLAAWQLRLRAGDATDSDRTEAARPLAIFAILSTCVAMAIAFVAWHVAHGESNVLASRIGFGAFIALFVAQTLAIPCWLTVAARRSLNGASLWLLFGCSLASIFAVSILREAHRLALLAGTNAAPREPAPVGGLAIFLIFTLLGVGTIVWITRTVARSLTARTA
ncbi:MAG: hypothetical protein RL591_461 [Planctomycetota bacterium]